ncbi:MAG: hypothetical protein FJ143_00360 [Deltaproteobacteria bacterium]|nr:hypothetical protein [Deltaproteobacteria bacterium]
MAKTSTLRTRRAKPEVEKHFANLVEEVAEEKESYDVKAAEVAKLHQAEIEQAVVSVSVEGVVQNLSNLGLEVSKALAAVSAKLVAEVERLTSVREAVALQTKEIDRLHKIDTAATAIDYMIQDYESQKYTVS